MILIKGYIVFGNRAIGVQSNLFRNVRQCMYMQTICINVYDKTNLDILYIQRLFLCKYAYHQCEMMLIHMYLYIHMYYVNVSIQYILHVSNMVMQITFLREQVLKKIFRTFSRIVAHIVMILIRYRGLKQYRQILNLI